MEDIVIFDNRSQTETTLVLNKDGDVIGTETYFSTPRELASFFNKNEMFQQQSNSKINRPRSIAQNNSDVSLHFENGLGPIVKKESYNPNVRFEVSKAAPCNGLGQRPRR